MSQALFQMFEKHWETKTDEDTYLCGTSGVLRYWIICSSTYYLMKT